MNKQQLVALPWRGGMGHTLTTQQEKLLPSDTGVFLQHVNCPLQGNHRIVVYHLLSQQNGRQFDAIHRFPPAL